MKFVYVIACLVLSIITDAVATVPVPTRIYFETIGNDPSIIREIEPNTLSIDQINYTNGITFRETRYSVFNLQSKHSDHTICFGYIFRKQEQPHYYNWDDVNHFPDAVERLSHTRSCLNYKRLDIVRGGEDITINTNEKKQIINTYSDTVLNEPISIRVANKIRMTNFLMSTPCHIDICSLVENSLISQVRITPRPYKYTFIDQFYMSQTCVLTTDIDFERDNYSLKVYDADVQIFFNHCRMQQLNKDQNEFCRSFLN